ncbi:glycosyltransferase [Patescibacteria group bacterium]|nr:glycosyltransferase [Patescibacteria group bacterium]
MDKIIKENPKITVLMPVFNGEKYLKEAIESVLNQTFTNFEFLIINDGSTDSTEKIIKSYSDSRIKLINNKKNIGVIRSLNKGLSLSKGEYIARMDADDISLPKRLEIQVEFMDKNPQIGIAGAWAKIIGEKKIRCSKPIVNQEKIKIALLFKCPMIHPSVIIRKNFLVKNNLNYNIKYKHAEDYDLWTRAIKYFPITNIKKTLIQYRIHDSNISKTQSNNQNETATQIRVRQLKENLKINPTDEDITIHENIYKPESHEIKDFLENEENWFNLLKNQNKITNFYKEPEFSQVLSQRWLQICSVNSNNDWKIWKRFWRSSLRKKLDIKEWKNCELLIRFFIKCTFK